MTTLLLGSAYPQATQPAVVKSLDWLDLYQYQKMYMT